jgi:hypothetical protein
MRSWRQPNEDATVPGGAKICWEGLADAATAEDILATMVKLCLKYQLRIEVRGLNKSMRSNRSNDRVWPLLLTPALVAAMNAGRPF